MSAHGEATNAGFTHVPHPRIEARKSQRPVRVVDEHIGFNGRLGVRITRGAGTMWAFYAAMFTLGGWMLLAEEKVFSFDPFPYAFLLFLGNIVQLLLMFVIMVGQQVLGAASDKRAMQTYEDAEAVLHECQQLQAHLLAQDKVLQGIIEDLKAR